MPEGPPRPDPMAGEVGYADLTGALASPGCPVCLAANRAAARYLKALLWEFVNDTGTRRRLRASRGFCREHTVMALRVADEQAAALGMAILYQDFCRRALEDAASAAAAKRRRGEAPAALATRGSCPGCETARRTAENCLRLLGIALPDSRIGRGARQPERFLCLPHLAEGMSVSRTKDAAGRLVEIFEGGIAEVAGDLGELIRKHDHRFKDEPPGREVGAWRRAPWLIAGRPPG